jgi:putative ABC transport system permease protein
LLFSYWTTRAVLGVIPPGDVGLDAGIAIDQRMLWFSLVISLVTALSFGLLPALNSFRVDLVQSIAADSMPPGRVMRKVNLRRALVVVQIVASLVLLIADGLFLRSFQKGLATGESFRSDRILLLDLSPKKYGYSVKYTKAFYRELLARIGAMPGVDAVTLSDVLPLTMNRSSVMVKIEGRGPESLHDSIVADGYFQTLRIPILLSRGFDSGDDESSHRVAIINETMARTYWPGENPLGKVLDMGARYEIVGVAKDSPYSGFGKTSEPYVYGCVYQHPEQSVSLIVRTAGEPSAMIGAVQREIEELGADLPVFDFKTLDDVSKSQLVPVNATAALLTLLSLIGLLVASIGIYGATSSTSAGERLAFECHWARSARIS